MKTCRFCLSEDVPDAASHCRHCGKRLKRSQVGAAVIPVAIGCLVLAWAIVVARKSSQLDFDRSNLKIEMDSMKQVCTPDSPEEFLSVATDQFNQHVAASSLEPEEKRALSDVWENNLAICRSKNPKPKK